MKAKKHIDAIATMRAEMEQLDRDDEEIRYNSPAARLERNRVRRLELVGLIHEEDRQLKRLENAVPPTQREVELKEEWLALESRIRITQSDATGGRGVIAEKFVRLDAVEHFGAEAAKAKKDLVELESQANQANVRPGARLRSDIIRLENIIREWDATKKLCVAGEKIAALKQLQAKITNERVALEEKRRKSALQVA